MIRESTAPMNVGRKKKVNFFIQAQQHHKVTLCVCVCVCMHVYICLKCISNSLQEDCLCFNLPQQSCSEKYNLDLSYCADDILGAY